MSNQQILFVADTAFIDSSTTAQYDFLSVFPKEAGDGAYRATLDDLAKRSKLQSSYYDELMPKLLPVFNKYMPSAGNQVEHFLRVVLITITSLFTDRCIRVLHRINQQQSENIAVVAVESTGDFQKLEDIVQTWHLNQDIIQRIMTSLGCKKVHVLDKKNYPEYPNQHIQQNLMFSPQRPGLPGVFSTLLHRFFGLLEKVPNNKAKFQSLGFTMDRYYLAKHGMLGPFSFFQKRFNLDLEPSLKNLKLRESLLGDLEVILKPQYERFLLQILGNLQKRKLKQLSLAYCCILVDWFPILFLEGLSLNLKKVSQKLCVDNSVGTIGHSIDSDLGYLVSAVTRLAGKTIFGIQHGGHNGYIDDNAAHGQIEYALYDKMITWGWTEIDDHLPHCETIPLPSPKLSEQSLKANYLKNVKSKSKDMRDILFLSNLFHRFPYASTCGQSRVDFIDEITNSQEDLMLAIKDAELTVCHKPYNMRFVDLYPEHYRRIEMAGGTGYQLLKSTHKGLKVKLIMTCRILLWDQIGTGTLECLTSEVPSMIYWKRIYSRESLWAKDLIARLEQNGIIHSSPETLTQEIKRYLGDPESWMNNSSRKQAIKDFCQKFALTDPRWFDKWKEFLSQSSMQ